MSFKFQKGDVVRRIGDFVGCKDGTIGTVVKRNPAGSLQIRWNNGNNSTNVASTRVSMVSSTPAAATAAQTSTGTTTMNSFSISIAAQTLVNGKVIDKNTSQDELFAIITAAEEELKTLKKMKAQPAALVARKKALKQGIEDIVALCDKLFPAE